MTFLKTLILTKEQSIAKLQQQLDLVNELKVKSYSSIEFVTWYRNTQVAIEQIFGKDKQQLQDFTNINFNRLIGSVRIPTFEYQRAFQRGLEQAGSILRALIIEIDDYWNDELSVPVRDHLLLVERICNRFHLVAQQICSQYRNRQIITVNDEYDVQYLLHTLLVLEFDDIRPEDWVPSYAGGGSRVDFLLKQEKIVIEAKKTRHNFGGKEVGEQLIIDIQRYKSHPDCQILMCFVYDPDGRIANPRGIENDLNGQHNELQVKVIIAPRN